MKFNLNGLYVITDNNLIERDSFISTVESALKGGANIIQLREKGGSEDEVIALGKSLLEITSRYNAPLIINDSPKIAKKIGADGVHLGVNDPNISTARDILGVDAIIGVSCYNSIQRGIDAEKMGADYVAFGTPFSTPTKPDREPTSLEILSEACSLVSIPVFAIGGIFPHNAKQILNTGVDGLAVITAIFKSENPKETSKEFSKLIAETR